ncbi:hypothetical protein [Pseudomonas cichorii]|uniref:hypothetical protein n=1 Tax=Pseudomonas cichorii TaxID=36746 RepID=UPI0011C3757F|nr:hypothetical protein [Pseudomonas cichorii]
MLASEQVNKATVQAKCDCISGIWFLLFVRPALLRQKRAAKHLEIIAKTRSDHWFQRLAGAFSFF